VDVIRILARQDRDPGAGQVPDLAVLDARTNERRGGPLEIVPDSTAKLT
jgi:hypothetical protein